MNQTEKTTTEISQYQTTRMFDLETILTNEEQDKILYTTILILLVVIFINTYLW